MISRGAIALGTITEAEHKKSMGRGGKLNVNIDSVKLRDGEKVALRAVKDNQAGGHIGAMTGAMVATAIVFFPAAPLFLFMKGKDMNIPKGTEITAYINGNAPLERAKFEDSAKPSVVVASGTVRNGANAPSMVAIASNPSGADVELDGAFAGNTPSQVSIAAGEHTVKVSKSGFKPWERRIRISGGTVSLNAELNIDTPSTVPATAPQKMQPDASEAKTVEKGKESQAPLKTEEPAAPASAGAAGGNPEVHPAVLKSLVSTHSAASPGNGSAAPSTTGNEGMASITSSPDGADIFIDSIGKGKAPSLVKLTAGKHSIQLVLVGYKDWLSEIETKPGSMVNVTATFEKGTDAQ